MGFKKTVDNIIKISIQSYSRKSKNKMEFNKIVSKIHS